MQHLLKMLDLSGEEILNLLNMADQLKYEQKHHIPHPHLKGQSLGMIFQKSSTRTRVSFEVGMYPEVQLGQYKGLEVPQNHEAFDESKVDEEMHNVQKRNARLLDV